MILFLWPQEGWVKTIEVISGPLMLTQTINMKITRGNPSQKEMVEAGLRENAKREKRATDELTQLSKTLLKKIESQTKNTYKLGEFPKDATLEKLKNVSGEKKATPPITGEHSADALLGQKAIYHWRYSESVQAYVWFEKLPPADQRRALIQALSTKIAIAFEFLPLTTSDQERVYKVVLKNNSEQAVTIAQSENKKHGVTSDFEIWDSSMQNPITPKVITDPEPVVEDKRIMIDCQFTFLKVGETLEVERWVLRNGHVAHIDGYGKTKVWDLTAHNEVMVRYTYGHNGQCKNGENTLKGTFISGYFKISLKP